MKETLILGKILLSLKCCMLHTSRRLGYIVLAIEGQVVVVRMEGDNIVQIFSGPDAKPMKNIRGGNYMAYKKNRLQFGKLVMNDADLILIDMDLSDPLDFFLDHYKEQLSAGYTKTTMDSGLRLYIKDYNKLHPAEAPPGNDKTK